MTPARPDASTTATSGASDSTGSPGTTDGLDRGEVADQAATAALGVKGVTRLHSGTFGEVATYLPGRRVDGVRVRREGVEVHIVTSWEAPILQTADAVRTAVAALPGLADVPVDVAVEDVDAPRRSRSATKAAASSASPAKE